MVLPRETPVVETDAVATPLLLVIPVPETTGVEPLVIVKVMVCLATAGRLTDVKVSVAETRLWRFR